MVQIIAGQKGKGKTKHLINMANAEVKSAHGTFAYLDKSSKHMYELDKNIRLINVKDYPIESEDGFIGFISGIISQDYDLETVFLDSYLKLACLEGEDITSSIDILEKLSEKHNIKFVLSISLDESELPLNAKKNVLISL